MSRISDTELVGYNCFSLDYNEKEKNFSFEWKFNISREFDRVVLDAIRLPDKCVRIIICMKFSKKTKILEIVTPNRTVDLNGCVVVMNGTCEMKGLEYNDGLLCENHYEYYNNDIKVNVLNNNRINGIPYVFIYLGELAY